MLIYVELILLNCLFLVYYYVCNYPFIDRYLDCCLFWLLKWHCNEHLCMCFLSVSLGSRIIGWWICSYVFSYSVHGTPLQHSCLEKWTEEPGRLQSIGSLRVGHDWATSLSVFTFMHWRRKWQPTPVFLPGESQGWGSLVGCRLWDRTELDTTEAT